MRDINTFQKIEVHQYHASVAPFDAITQQMFFLQKALRGVGVGGRIFAHHIHPHLREKVQMPGPSLWNADCLLLHHSFGNPKLDELLLYTLPKVLLYHNITPAQYLRHDSELFRNSLLGRRQLRKLGEHTVAALADSDYNADELKSAGITRTKVLPLFDTENLISGEGKQNWNARKPRFLFVGRVTRHKNQAVLIRMLKAYRDRYASNATLSLVGGMDPIYGAYLKLLIRNLELGDCVFLRGKVSEKELAAEYAKADAFVCASEHEGFCVPLVEAMKSKLLVFAFPRTVIQETLGNAGVHLVSEEPARIAESLHYVLSRPELARKILDAQNARMAEIRLRQNPERATSVILNLVRDIRAQRPTAGNPWQIQSPRNI